MKTTIQLLRHGKTNGNKEKRYVGKTDERLSMEGIEKIRASRKNNQVPDLLFTSPMMRCLETCELLFPGKEKKVIPSFEEMDFGDFEMKNYSELKENKMYQKWIDSNGTQSFPNGESRKTFIERSWNGFTCMLDEVARWGQQNQRENICVCAVVHGGTIMAVMSTILDGEYYDFQCENGNGFVIDMEKTETGWKYLDGTVDTVESVSDRKKLLGKRNAYE